MEIRFVPGGGWLVSEGFGPGGGKKPTKLKKKPTTRLLKVVVSFVGECGRVPGRVYGVLGCCVLFLGWGGFWLGSWFIS